MRWRSSLVAVSRTRPNSSAACSCTAWRPRRLAARGRPWARSLRSVSRTSTAIISSLATQGDRDVLLAQHHRLVLPALGRERPRPRPSQPGSGAGGVAQRGHRRRWLTARRPRRCASGTTLVGLAHDLLGDAHGVQAAAELAGERLQPADQADGAAVRRRRRRVVVIARRRASPIRPMPDRGGEPGERRWRRTRGPTPGSTSAQVTSSSAELGADHAQHAGAPAVDRADQHRDHQVRRDGRPGRGRPAPPATATAPPSKSATVDSRNRCGHRHGLGNRRRVSTTNSAPSRYRWPATAASEVRAATVNTRAARATRPTSVTLRVCPRSCP